MRWALAWLLLALSSAQPAISQPIRAEKLERLRGVVDAIYRMQYNEAAALCRKMISESPEDPAGYVFLARTYWQEEMNRHRAFGIDRFGAPDFFAEKQQSKYKIQVSSDAEERFDRTNDEAINKAKSFLDREPASDEARFLLGLAYQNQVTFEASLKGSWWAAARAGDKTRRYHGEIYKANPNFADPLLALGVYDYVAGSVPLSIRWLTFLLGHRGNRERGKERLETAAREAVLVKEDAQVVLILIYARKRESAYDKAYAKLTALGEQYPENYLFQLDRASVTLRMERPQQAIEILNGVLARIRSAQYGYEQVEPAVVYNQLGLAFRETGDLAEAEKWFHMTLNEESSQPRSVVLARLELGKTLDLQRRRSDAVQQYEIVWKAEDIAGSREEASQYLKRPYVMTR